MQLFNNYVIITKIMKIILEKLIIKIRVFKYLLSLKYYLSYFVSCYFAEKDKGIIWIV